jgi:uncharacterized protein YggU (UPF0235/DUF167 family)
MAQLDVLGMKEKANTHKEHILKTLGIQRAPMENYLEAWTRTMAQENGVELDKALAEITKEGQANASLASFLLTMA